MPTSRATLLFTAVLFAVVACHSPALMVVNQDLDQSVVPVNTAGNTEISTLTFTNGSALSLASDTQINLFLEVSLSNGKVYHGITKTFQSLPYGINENVLWYSNNKAIAAVSTHGVVTAKSEGETTIIASLGNKSVALTVSVKAAVTETELVTEFPSAVEEPYTTESTSNESGNSNEPTQTAEEPTNNGSTDSGETTETAQVITADPLRDTDDAFLGSGDIITLDLGTHGGYGIESYPNIIYGPPVGVYDVLSLGNRGSITIELKDYFIVNTDGPDFTIFENPFPGWQQCATVSVSEDGGIYHSFECDQTDVNGVFSGCAGVHEVNYGLADEDYLNASVSGGDSFDLSDLSEGSVDEVHYIKITDIGLCEAGADNITYGYYGFGLDALVLLHGQYE